MFGETTVRRTRLPIMKLGAGQSCDCVCRARNPLGFHVHWMGRRSYVCPGQDCPACLAYVGARYLSILPVEPCLPQGKSVGTYLLELSAGSNDRLCGLMKIEGCKTLLGMRVSVFRRHKRSGVRVEPDFVYPRVACDALPDGVLCDALATIYALPSVQEGESRDSWTARIQPFARKLLASPVAQLEGKAN